MAIRHQIELWMTVAFMLYLGAFFLARKRWNTHVILATLGFVADMYATYLMSFSSIGGNMNLPLSVEVHTLLAAAAISAFCFLAAFGLQTLRYKKEFEWYSYRLWKNWHIKWAKFVFLPIWILTYLSGFALVFV